jgi:hypothetical protein
MALSFGRKYLARLVLTNTLAYYYTELINNGQIFDSPGADVIQLFST